WVRWNQIYSLFQIRQIDFSQLLIRFRQLVNNECRRDFEEMQRNWQRGAISTEQYFAGVRAKAMLADDKEVAQSTWVKYRTGMFGRGIRLTFDQSRLLEVLNEPRDGSPKLAPYEYSEQVKARVRERLRAEKSTGGAQ